MQGGIKVQPPARSRMSGWNGLNLWLGTQRSEPKDSRSQEVRVLPLNYSPPIRLILAVYLERFRKPAEKFCKSAFVVASI